MSNRVCLFATLLIGSTAASADPDPAVVAARVRQDGTKSLVLEYRQINRLYQPATAARPAMESTAISCNRIVLDGDKVRVEDNNPSMSAASGMQRGQRINIFDGNQSRTLFPTGIGPNEPPMGIIHAKEDSIEAHLPQAIFLYARGLDRRFRSITIDQWQPTGKSQLIDGANCQEYLIQRQDSTTRYWVDPAKGHLVRRTESLWRDRLTRRETISYREEPATGWVPAGWRMEELNADGTVKYVRDVTVTKLERNGLVENSEFRLDFQPGANVYSQQERTDYRVEADGQLRALTAQELFGSPPRTTIRQWLAQNVWYLVLAATAVVAGMVAILMWRRQRTEIVHPLVIDE
jgi:hypothetical protein